MRWKNKFHVYNIYYLFGAISVVFALAFFGSMFFLDLQDKRQELQLAAVASAFSEYSFVRDKSLSDITVNAKSAFVYDIARNKVLYDKNGDLVLPLASLTKLMTAYVARKRLGANTPVYISKQVILTEGDSGLIQGDVWNSGDLIDFMLTVSSNDAAVALSSAKGSRAEFIEKMNDVARGLGLTSMYFFNETGLDINAHQAGAYGSARDIAYLLAYISMTKPQWLEATTFPYFTSVSLTGLRYDAINTNSIIKDIPAFIGGKTGFTDLAGGNLAIVFDAGMGRPVVVVVMGSTKEGRFKDVLTIINQII